MLSLSMGLATSRFFSNTLIFTSLSLITTTAGIGALLASIWIGFRNSNKSKIEKWLPKSQLKELEEGVWEIPSWLGGPINYDLIVANNPNKSWKPRSWEKN